MPRLTADQVQSFADNGFLVLPGTLGAEELAAVRADMDHLTQHPEADHPDFSFSKGHRDGGSVPASGVTRVSDASGQAASPPWMARGGGSSLRTRARLS